MKTENLFDFPPSKQTVIFPKLVHEWHILRPIVYRYMDEQYVDEFFKTGKLRLAKLQNFINKENLLDAQYDAAEGSAFLYHDIGEKIRGVSCNIHPQNAYIFCTSLVLSENIKNDFCTNSAFLIKDTTTFSQHVSRKLKGFCGGAEGMCIYKENIVLRRYSEEATKEQQDFFDKFGKLDTYNEEQIKNHFENGIKLTIKNGYDLDMYFKKPIRHVTQMEYRMIWFVDYDIEDNDIFIEIPDAADLCQKIVFD